MDAVVEAADGCWAALEIRLGERWVPEAQANLRRLADRVAGSDHGEPVALAVVAPNGYGYAGGDDIGVIPVGALGP